LLSKLWILALPDSYGLSGEAQGGSLDSLRFLGLTFSIRMQIVPLPKLILLSVICLRLSRAWALESDRLRCLEHGRHQTTAARFFLGLADDLSVGIGQET